MKLQGQTYKGTVRDRTQGRGTFETRSGSADQVCGRYSGEFVGDEAHGLGVLEQQTDAGTWEAVSCRWTHGRFHSSNHGHRVSRRLVEGKVEYKLDGGNFRNHAISEWRDIYGVIKRTFDGGRFKPRKKKHARLLKAALKMEVTPTPGRPRPKAS